MTTVQVGDRTLKLSNLDKVLYPEAGFTKAEVIHYYANVARPCCRTWPAARSPSAASRTASTAAASSRSAAPATVHRGCGWRSAPAIARAASSTACSTSPPALVWAANMAALELHAPMALAEDLDAPRAVVFDLDPGAPADIHTCCELALSIRDVLLAIGLDVWAKTSGSKGLQLYVPVNGPLTHEDAGRLRPRRRSAAGEAAAEAGRDHDVEGGAAGEGVRGLEPEQPSQDHGRRVLAAGPAPPDGVDPGRVGGGGGERRRSATTSSSRLLRCSTGSERHGDLFAPVLDDRAAAARVPGLIGQPGYLAPAQAMMPAARSSAGSRPSSATISSECSPTVGAGAPTLAGRGREPRGRPGLPHPAGLGMLALDEHLVVGDLGIGREVVQREDRRGGHVVGERALQERLHQCRGRRLSHRRQQVGEVGHALGERAEARVRRRSRAGRARRSSPRTPSRRWPTPRCSRPASLVTW